VPETNRPANWLEDVRLGVPLAGVVSRTVAPTSRPSRALPQDGQKRLASGASWEQERQRDATLNIHLDATLEAIPVRNIWISAAALLVSATSTPAGLPDPSRSAMGLFGQGTSCHYRFRMDGGLDQLTVCVTLRTQFDTPIPDCSTSVTLTPNAGTIAFGTCCPNPQAGVTDFDGTIQFVFDQIGGRGSLDVCATEHCIAEIGVATETIDFTSPDLDASGGHNVVIDLGIWAGCYQPAPYCPWSDYNCDGTVDVLDLGLWAGGIGLECGQTACP
jgi:hypothetical protein